MPRIHTHFPELDLDASLTPEERDIIEKAEELIHDISFLDTKKTENILDWLYQFSFTTKSLKTRRGYNYILQVLYSKGVPYAPEITEADIQNKDQFALYLISIAITAMREYRAIPNRLEPLIVYWKKLHTNAKKFEILDYQDGENIETFLRRAVQLSEKKKIDVYIKFDFAVYFRDHTAVNYHTEDEELLYILGALKSRVDLSIPNESIPLSSIKSLNFQKKEDILDYFFRGVFPLMPQGSLSPEWKNYILQLFQNNGYGVRQDLQTPPQTLNEEQYARYIIEICLYEIYHFGIITNNQNWFTGNIISWKNMYGTKEIWSPKKVFENGQKRIPKVLRKTKDKVAGVLDDEGEKGRFQRLVDFLKRK